MFDKKEVPDDDKYKSLDLQNSQGKTLPVHDSKMNSKPTQAKIPSPNVDGKMIKSNRFEDNSAKSSNSSEGKKNNSSGGYSADCSSLSTISSKNSSNQANDDNLSPYGRTKEKFNQKINRKENPSPIEAGERTSENLSKFEVSPHNKKDENNKIKCLSSINTNDPLQHNSQNHFMKQQASAPFFYFNPTNNPSYRPSLYGIERYKHNSMDGKRQMSREASKNTKDTINAKTTSNIVSEEKKIQQSASTIVPQESLQQKANESKDNLMPTIENYTNLMETCRPFFTATDNEKETETTEPLSSLTLKKTQSHKNENSSKEKNSLEHSHHKASLNSFVKNKLEAEGSSRASFAMTTVNSLPESSSQSSFSVSPKPATNLKIDDSKDVGESDSSSMVVLARSKKKYKQNQHHRQSNEESDDSSSSSKPSINTLTQSIIKKVEKTNPSQFQTESESTIDSKGKKSTPTSSSSSINRQIKNEKIETKNHNSSPEVTQEGNKNNGSNTETKKRIVTDTSASDSKINNNTSSSGSGNGSGGSGNERNENSGCGSDEGGSRINSHSKKNDRIQTGSRDESTSNENSHYKDSGANYDEKSALTTSNGIERNHNSCSNDLENENQSSNKQAIKQKPTLQDESNTSTCFLNGNKSATDGSHNDEMSHQQKLLTKKRKRMNMRREYEEQQHYDSSDTSLASTILLPGKPVTLEDVLFFSKNARLVLQATPPFLVVHANAAYANLSGFDSHYAIGKALSTLMSLSQNKAKQIQSQTLEEGVGLQRPTGSSHSNLGSYNGSGDSLALESSNVDVPFEILVACSGFSDHHEVNLNLSNEHYSRKWQQNHQLQRDFNGSNNVEGKPNPLPCIMAVSPVLASKSATLSWNSCKSHHSIDKGPRFHSKKIDKSDENIITHFAIQLEPLVLKKKNHIRASSLNFPLQHQNDANGRSFQRNDEVIHASDHAGEISRESPAIGPGRGSIGVAVNDSNLQDAQRVDFQIDPVIHEVPLPLESTDDDQSSSTGTKHIITCG